MAQSTAPPTEDAEPLSAAAILGENLYRRRVLSIPRLSQEALAHRSGVSVNTIAQIEAARDPKHAPTTQPQLDTIERLAVGLGCEVADLLKKAATRAYPSGQPSHLRLIHGSGHGSTTRQLPLSRLLT